MSVSNYGKATGLVGSSQVLLASNTTSNTTSNTIDLAGEGTGTRSWNARMTTTTTTTTKVWKTIPIVGLRPGMLVETLRGPREVRTILRCRFPVSGSDKVALQVPEAEVPLRFTPWHPVSLDGGRTWVFPATQPSAQAIRDCKERTYAVQLQRSTEEEGGDHPDAHTINVNGVWIATLGHGLVGEEEAAARDVRNHPFYGDHRAVAANLDLLPRTYIAGLPVADAVTRDDRGLVNGFVGSQGPGLVGPKELPKWLPLK